MHSQDELELTAKELLAGDADVDDKHCPRCDSTELAPEREGDVCPVCEQRDD